MLDTTKWSEAEHAAAKAEIAVYKEQLRPLIREARLYHVSARPDGMHWDGMEYLDSARQKGVLYVFRGTTSDEAEHVFRLQGIRPNSDYRLHFQDGSNPDRTVRGQELLDSGLTMRLNAPNSSELVFLEAIQTKP
jgi:alpha-galactosidase